MNNTEIRVKGLQALTESLGDVEAERFVSLIQKEPFDYTKWRQGLDENLSRSFGRKLVKKQCH